MYELQNPASRADKPGIVAPPATPEWLQTLSSTRMGTGMLLQYCIKSPRAGKDPRGATIGGLCFTSRGLYLSHVGNKTVKLYIHSSGSGPDGVV